MFAEQCGSESDKHLLKLSRVRALSYWLCCSSFMLDSFTQNSLVTWTKCWHFTFVRVICTCTIFDIITCCKCDSVFVETKVVLVGRDV